MNVYTKVTNYENNPNYQAIDRVVVNSITKARNVERIYIPADQQYDGMKIPARRNQISKTNRSPRRPARNTLTLDPEAIKEAQEWADQITRDLS